MDYGDIIAAILASVLIIFGTNFQYISRLPSFVKVARILGIGGALCITAACLILVAA